MFAVIYLPQFHLQAALRFEREGLEKCVALVDEQSSKGKILELTAAAEKAGLSAGMSSTQALARCPAISLRARSAAQEKAAAAALVELAFSATPYVELTRDGVCTLDLQRSGMKDHATWGGGMIERLRALHLRGQIGVAANPELALLAAQSAQPVRVVADSAAFLADLEVAALLPAAPLASVLHDWGIHHLGALTQLAKSDVIERLGVAGGELWTRAAGQSTRVLRLVRMPEIFEESCDFECEIETTEPLLFIARRLLEQLSLRLQNVYRVAEKMILELRLSQGPAYVRAFAISAPTAKVEALFRVLDTHFEQLKLEHAPTSLRLRLEPAAATREQFRLFENPLRDPNRFSETLARLAAIVGQDRVGVPQLAATHRPDPFQIHAPQFSAACFESAPHHSAETKIGLPLRRFRPPISANVEVARARPAHIISERVSGRIIAADGPFRSSGEWWDEHAWRAEEWDIETARGLHRIRCENGRWAVEGCYELR